MPESPPPPAPSKKKVALLLVLMMAAFYTVAPHLLGAVLSIVYPTKRVDYEDAIHARITNTWMNRQYYQYYLNGDRWVMHDFISFVAADSTARTGMNDTIGWDPSDLSHYLRKGDSISKAAHSPLLTVHRGATTTHWILYDYTPEGRRPPPPEKPIVELTDDTVGKK